MKNIKTFENHSINESEISQIAKDIAAATKEAYSYDRYKADEWVKIVQFLLDKQYTPEDVEDIMNSVIMRHVANSANKQSNMTLSLFKQHFGKSDEKAIDNMIRTDSQRETKMGSTEELSKKFKTEIISLIGKYKSKISDEEMNTIIKDTFDLK